MIDRGLLTHGTLAVAASALALVAWLSPEGTDAASITLIAGDPAQLTAVEWSDSEADVTVRKLGEAAEVEVVSKRGSKADGASPAPQAPGEPKVFPGTDKAEALFTELVPLAAVRGLGATDAARLPTFGLDEPLATLRLRFGERVEEVQVGNGTYGGSNVYVRADDGQIYLLKSSTLADLKAGGNALIERQALNLPRNEITRVVVSAGDKSRELVQQNREARMKSFYSDPSAPETRLNQSTTWVDRALRLRVIEPQADKPLTPPVASLEAFGEQGSLGKLVLYAPAGEHAVVESSTFKAPVMISKTSVEALLKDVDAVLAEKP